MSDFQIAYQKQFPARPAPTVGKGFALVVFVQMAVIVIMICFITDPRPNLGTMRCANAQAEYLGITFLEHTDYDRYQRVTDEKTILQCKDERIFTWAYKGLFW